MTEDTFSEAFLCANANRQFIAPQMADVLLELIRDAASEDGTGFKASEKMDFVSQLLQRCDEPLSWWNLFSDALGVLRANRRENGLDDEYLRAATRGIKYFAESSAGDPAARARASRRRDEFHASVNQLLS
jgi:hypothetical protein